MSPAIEPLSFSALDALPASLRAPGGAAREFEALLMRVLLQSIDLSGAAPKKTAFAHSLFGELLKDHLARDIVHRHSLGFGRLLLENHTVTQ